MKTIVVANCDGIARDRWSVVTTNTSNNVELTDDLGTFPRNVMFFVAFSLAMRILCFGAIVVGFFVNSNVKIQSRSELAAAITTVCACFPV